MRYALKLIRIFKKNRSYLLRTPPSSEAFKHSGGDSLLCTSATVTLYFEVELKSDNRPGTEQNTSEGTIPNIMLSWLWWLLLWWSRDRIPEKINYLAIQTAPYVIGPKGQKLARKGQKHFWISLAVWPFGHLALWPSKGLMGQRAKSQRAKSQRAKSQRAKRPKG